jgi:hypothetical protein
MKRTLSIAFAGVLVTSFIGYSQTAQDSKPAQETKTDKSTPPAPEKPASTSEDAQKLTTGQITKIDTKKKILTVREAPLNQPSDSGPTSTGNRRGGGGGGMGGGRRRGGVGYPGGGGGYPGGGRPSSSSTQNKGKEFKVTVTDQTAIKDNVTTIGFDLLRVGDRISIQGLPKGKGDDLQATQITVSQ